MIYKDIGIETESSYGASTAGTAVRLKVRTADIALNPNKELVEDTTVGVRGRDRMTSLRNSVEGTITTYATPRNLHHMLEMTLGSLGSSAPLGGSNALAAVITYSQNTSGSWISKTVNKDYNNSQERFSGVVGTQLEMSFSDALIELSMDTLGQQRLTGISMAGLVGETVKPFSFSDVQVYVARGNSAQGLTSIKVEEFTLTYQNGIEGTYLSGNDNIARVDPLIPAVTGSFTFFHESDSYRTATFGCSEYFVRLEATLPDCHGNITGGTPIFLRIDIPRAEFTTNTVAYEQATLAKEQVEFTGMVETGVSYMMQVQMTVPASI